MTAAEQKTAAKQFSEEWKNRGYEKGESQVFWITLLRKVFGIEEPEKFIIFEEQVHLDNTSFIDGYIPSTHVLIEQKSLGKDLRKPIKQSDGTLLNPFQQAKRYSSELPYSQRPRWIITCNFSSFLVYDMEKPNGEPEEILLENLGKEYYRLDFMVKQENQHLKREMDISLKAGDIVGIIYNELLQQYKDPSNEHSLKSLNMLCVRLVFCLYAEDADVFGRKNMFHDYIESFDVRNMRNALIDLFKCLDTKIEDRDPYMDNMLAEFPYVNGGLFSDENIEIPQFTEKLRDIILKEASENFDWSDISPTIFGAVFESTLNPETRRSGGMHYTSIENIHKVIDPLFLDELNEEFANIKEIKVLKTKESKLKSFQKKLSELKFLDPACGSGNFLTETYISLRRLENKILTEIIDCQKSQISGQIALGIESITPISVSISQFYGIEINDFAVTVAKTALWIAESQMMKETESIVHMSLDFLPLKTNAYIAEGNALRIDWESVVPKNELNYIMGNPPFIGANNVKDVKQDELVNLFGENKKAGLLDYVSGWYKKASDLITSTNIKVAFVSTNSITQGEQPAILWKQLFENGIHINFAYRTFRWDSEAKIKAHVHCIIIGFSKTDSNKKLLFFNNRYQLAENINAYLLNAPDIFIERRTKPICNVPKCSRGNQPTDGGNLIIEADDYEDFIKSEPKAKKYIKKLIGSYEFINQKNRYCLWLINATPNEINSMPLVLERIKKVKEARENSSFKPTRDLAQYPTRFRETLNPDTYVVIPRVSSEQRKYIPMGFLDKQTIPTDSVIIIPNATLYNFGVLTSNIHMAWVRAFCGRLKSDYRYSKDIVYNNFPWCTPTAEQKAKIEKTAQAILDARALYPDSSLADLYNDLLMPPELRKAHQQNDKAVMEAYGITKDMEAYRSESACVALLMEMYKELTQDK